MLSPWGTPRPAKYPLSSPGREMFVISADIRQRTSPQGCIRYYEAGELNLFRYGRDLSDRCHSPTGQSRPNFWQEITEEVAHYQFKSILVNYIIWLCPRECRCMHVMGVGLAFFHRPHCPRSVCPRSPARWRTSRLFIDNLSKNLDGIRENSLLGFGHAVEDYAFTFRS